MSDRYAATGLQDVATLTPGDSALSLQSAATVRPEIYDLVFSQGSAPADTVIKWLVRRFDTADGTATGVTPIKLDDAAPASALVGQEDHTVEPTDSSEVPILDFDLNQRATFRWVAAPGGEIKSPAVATEGIYITPLAPASGGYLGICSVTAHWIE